MRTIWVCYMVKVFPFTDVRDEFLWFLHHINEIDDATMRLAVEINIFGINCANICVDLFINTLSFGHT